MELIHFLKEKKILYWLLLVITTIFFYLLLTTIQKFVVKRGRIQAQRTAAIWDDLVFDLLENLKRYFIFAISLYLGLLWVKLTSRPQQLAHKVFIIIGFLQLTHLAGVMINFWLTKHLKVKSGHDLAVASTMGLISIVVKFVVYTVIFLLALNNLGVNISALIAGLGVGGIAVALAMQNILADLFASLTIILDKPFIVGDFIVVADFMGTVEHIGLKTTRLRSVSGEQLIFGNGDLLQSRIKNFKRMNERRVVQTISVTYQTSADHLEKISGMIKEIVEIQKNVRFDRCHFLRFMDSSLDFELVYWVTTAEFDDYADVAQIINISIFKKFTQEGISFAYPTRTLHIENNQN